MQAYQVYWQAQAIQDLKNIRAYLNEIQAPIRILGKIVDQAGELCYFPGRFRKISETSDIRCLIVEDYSVFYRMIEEKRLVQILYVWHHSRELTSLSE